MLGGERYRPNGGAVGIGQHHLCGASGCFGRFHLWGAESHFRTVPFGRSRGADRTIPLDGDKGHVRTVLPRVKGQSAGFPGMGPHACSDRITWSGPGAGSGHTTWGGAFGLGRPGPTGGRMSGV